MKPLLPLPKHELLAAHLREGVTEGRWTGKLPGVRSLARELMVSHHTVRRALELLEAEGLLGVREVGRSRGITAAGHAAALRRPLRVGVLRHDARYTDDLQSNLPLIEMLHQIEVLYQSTNQCSRLNNLKRLFCFNFFPKFQWVLLTLIQFGQ
jgi:DNA-binding transcriptional MocR family regulator